MNIKSLMANQTYGVAQNALAPGPRATSRTGPSDPSLFEKYARSFVETMEEGEATASAGMVGKADAHSVVEALAATEIAVETAVTVRDKVVEAYQEILRMPV